MGTEKELYPREEEVMKCPHMESKGRHNRTRTRVSNNRSSLQNKK